MLVARCTLTNLANRFLSSSTVPVILSLNFASSASSSSFLSRYIQLTLTSAALDPGAVVGFVTVSVFGIVFFSVLLVSSVGIT